MDAIPDELLWDIMGMSMVGEHSIRMAGRLAQVCKRFHTAVAHVCQQSTCLHVGRLPASRVLLQRRSDTLPHWFPHVISVHAVCVERQWGQNVPEAMRWLGGVFPQATTIRLAGPTTPPVPGHDEWPIGVHRYFSSLMQRNEVVTCLEITGFAALHPYFGPHPNLQRLKVVGARYVGFFTKMWLTCEYVHLVHVCLNSSAFSSTDAVRLATQAPLLETAHLRSTQIGDDGVACLADSCRQLKELDVEGTNVTCVGVDSINRMENLQCLVLPNLDYLAGDPKGGVSSYDSCFHLLAGVASMQCLVHVDCRAIPWMNNTSTLLKFVADSVRCQSALRRFLAPLPEHSEPDPHGVLSSVGEVGLPWPTH